MVDRRSRLHREGKVELIRSEKMEWSASLPERERKREQARERAHPYEVEGPIYRLVSERARRVGSVC